MKAIAFLICSISIDSFVFGSLSEHNEHYMTQVKERYNSLYMGPQSYRSPISNQERILWKAIVQANVEKDYPRKRRIKNQNSENSLESIYERIRENGIQVEERSNGKFEFSLFK
ncbi:unnamed protein product [Caenorhabditis brenneri]